MTEEFFSDSEVRNKVLRIHLLENALNQNKLSWVELLSNSTKRLCLHVHSCPGQIIVRKRDQSMT